MKLPLFRSGDLFITGIFMIGAFLANPSTLFRTGQFALFGIYTLLMGKKIKFFSLFLTIFCVIFFNLLIPYGKILGEVGGFPITQGALLGGFRRAVTLEGLILISKASVQADLRFPGSFGSLLGESLMVFQRILDRKERITRTRLIEGIDELMLALSAEQESPREPPGVPRRLLGILLLGCAGALIFILTGLGFFFR
ncbi:MAG: hypothetical protein LBG90_01095 [Spirochaetaceae bacterium]|jgi:hypothetical protein|nr:hypothetical protein [Spirochaetaceae bacterium]